MPAFIVNQARYIEAPEDTATHCHAHYELIYVRQGRARLTIGGREYPLAGGVIAFVGAQEEHSLRIHPDTALYAFTLSPSRMDHRIGNPQLTAVFKNRPAHFRHCCEATPATDGLLRDILRECQLRDALSEDMIACYLHELLTEQYRRNRSMFPMPDSSIKPRVHQVKTYMDANFSREIKISELADMFYVNKYYLSHAFRALTGYSPKQYLQLNRLTYAKKLLTTTTLPVKQIALECGFPDSNSFIRAYKNEFGVTPHHSRKE